MSTITIQSVDMLCNVIKDSNTLHIIGNGSKTGLAQSDVQNIQLTGLTGITEYQPEEYTITVQAGTPITTVQDVLAEHGQYLPFDPLLADKATIGGTVAANLSGSRRFRYGGVRDFILGAQVVDGQGRAFRVGGKVVKNSAGFDLTKFLVGSMGLYAIMTDVTFKVFPDVSDFTTLAFTYASLDDALNAIYFLNQNVFELDALDIIPSQDTWTLLARMTGLVETLTERVERLANTLKENTQLRTYEEKRADHTTWTAHNSLSWSAYQTVVKVVLSPKHIPDFDRMLDLEHMTRRYSVGGNIAWITTERVDALAQILEQQGMTGLCVLGDGSHPIIGKPIDNPLSDRVKTIFDPENKFV